MSDPIERIPRMVAEAIERELERFGNNYRAAANAIAQAILDSQQGIDRVEMRPAYNWTCPECGRDCFVRSIAHPITAEDCEEMELDPEDARAINWQTYPTHVTCEHCDRTFKSIGFQTEDEDDDEDG